MTMKDLHLLDGNERRLFFEAAAAELKMPLEIIEKDFWVVWTLGRLFSLPDLLWSTNLGSTGPRGGRRPWC